jgi:hypothetical protein
MPLREKGELNKGVLKTREGRNDARSYEDSYPSWLLFGFGLQV